jgi:hypothetical protein
MRVDIWVSDIVLENPVSVVPKAQKYKTNNHLGQIDCGCCDKWFILHQESMLAHIILIFGFNFSFGF